MTLVAIDKQGRITLDEKVRAHAGLLSSSSVKVAGMFDAVEVWKPERFETVQVEGDHEEPARVGGRLMRCDDIHTEGGMSDDVDINGGDRGHGR